MSERPDLFVNKVLSRRDMGCALYFAHHYEESLYYQWGQQYLFQPGEERTELLDKKKHKALMGMEVQGADGKSCGFDDVELVRVKVTRGGGFKPVRT